MGEVSTHLSAVFQLLGRGTPRVDAFWYLLFHEVNSEVLSDLNDTIKHLNPSNAY